MILEKDREDLTQDLVGTRVDTRLGELLTLKSINGGLSNGPDGS